MRTIARASRALSSSLLASTDAVPSTGPAVIRAAAHRPALPLPSGPSCSRWFSCSCCCRRRTSSTGSQAFFFRNAVRVEQAEELELEDEAPDAVPETDQSSGSISHPRLSTLPLPPKLPWSPTSLPFQRHLEALSAAMLAPDPDGSWQVYTGLHSSLRRYIPDSLFRDLVTQQAAHPNPRQAWSRTRALLKLAHTCGLAYGSLGKTAVLAVLRAGLYPDARDDTSLRDIKLNYSIIRQLWLTYRELHRGPLSSIEQDIRAGWLLLPSPTTGADGERRDPLDRELEEMVRLGGAEDLGEVIGKALAYRMAESLNEPLRFARIRRLVWCWAEEIDIPDHAGEAVLEAMARPESLHDASSRVFGDLGLSLSSEAAVRLRRCALAVAKRRGAVKPILRILQSDYQASAPDLEAASMALMDETGPAADVDTLDAALESIKRASITDVPIFSVLLNRIAGELPASEHSQSATPYDAFILPFARFVVRSHVGRTLRLLLPYHQSNLLSHLTRLIDRQGGYDLARELYAAARAATPPFRWSEQTIDDWRRLFLHAIDPARGHLHFGSRLYEDLQADGFVPSRQEAIALVHAISRTQTASRPILLERHIRDYLAHGYGHSQELIDALIDGLTSSGDPRSAMTALNLALRLRGTELISYEATLKLVHVLAMCPEQRAQDAVRTLLDELPAEPRSIRAYNLALASIIKQASTAAVQAGESRLDMFRAAVVVYRDMITKKLKPGPQSVSLLIRGLVDCKRLDNAVECLKAALGMGILVKSGTAGRLLIALANASRFDEAETVLALWDEQCARSGSRAVWRKGVVGARVMLDVLQGRSVDLNRQVGMYGWRPNEHFAQWILQVQDANRPGSNGGAAVPSGALDASDDSDVPMEEAELLPEVDVRARKSSLQPRDITCERDTDEQQRQHQAELARFGSFHGIRPVT